MTELYSMWLTVIPFLFLLAACVKTEEVNSNASATVCSSSSVDFTNATPNVVFYCWNCPFLNDSIQPGETKNWPTGYLNIQTQPDGTITGEKNFQLHTNLGVYSIVIDECDETFVIQ